MEPNDDVSVSFLYSDTVEIWAKRRTIAAPRGSSIKLSCNATYYFDICDPVHIFWRLEESTEELKNPKKYLTTVSEMFSDGGKRLRQVETEILNLSGEDSGRYQCVAYCGGEQSAVGRSSEVDVRGKM